jgi:MFS family permease
MDDRHWTRKEMVRHPLFWFLMPAILGPAAWNTALFFQQVHVSEIKGWAHADFVALLPLFTAVSVAATFASGWAVDRFGAGWMMAAQGLPMVLGFGLLWSSDSLVVAAWAMSFIAVSAGSMATLPGSFAAEFYGTRHLGGIKSVWTAIMVLGSAVGPGFSGFLIDIGYDFSEQMLAISAYFVLSSALLFIGVAKVRSPRTLPT